jgi:hypothetical protein
MIIDAEFQALIPALSTEEHALLEQSLLNEGCRDALVVWRDTLIDGHNRYALCQKHSIEYKTVERDFQDRNEALTWIIQNQLGRRNIADYTRGKLALRLESVIAAQAKARQKATQFGSETVLTNLSTPINTRAKLAKAADLSQGTIAKVKAIEANAPAVIKAAVEAEEISIHHAYKMTQALGTMKEQSPTLYEETVGRGYIMNLDGEDVALVDADPTLLRVQSVQHEFESIQRQKDAIERKQARRESRKQEREIAVKVAENTAAVAHTQYKQGDMVCVGDHILICADSASDAVIAYAAIHNYTFAFCDIPYNADVDEWDEDFSWKHDWLTRCIPFVAVTPGISSIQAFMRVTDMPYVWSTAVFISNGMTRGALGFGNWIYTALFGDRSKAHRNAQDIHTIAITGKLDDLGAKRQKPPAYLAWLFQLMTKEGERILDPFAGSGTSVIVAHELGRKCTAIEIDPVTFGGMVARIEKAVGLPAELVEWRRNGNAV